MARLLSRDPTRICSSLAAPTAGSTTPSSSPPLSKFEPEAEVQITESLIRSLLQEQHPDLADRLLRIVNAGFDNELWRLGDDLAVRLPRRAVAAALIENEQRRLPGPATRVPLSVPVPLRIGKPSPGYPWPWSVGPWIAGEPGDQGTITDPDLAARQLGAFLRALHQPAPTSAPHNPWR